MERLSGLVVATFLLLVVAAIESSSYQLKEAYSWKVVDFQYPNDTVRQGALKSGSFVQENSLPLGVEVWKNKLFITLPRWKPGIPATLTYINLDDASGDKSPKLIPYPDWETHDLETNGSKIVSVFRLNVDVCDRLWMVDTGLVDILGEHKHIKAPRILVYDLKTDKLIDEYEVKKEHLKENTFLANIIVDVTPETCDKPFAYVTDLMAYGLIVYDMKNKDSWRIDHHYFHFDPLSGDYHIGGVNFQWNDGIFGIALSPAPKEGHRTLYFHPLSSTREFAVSTRVLQNKTNADSYHEYKILGSRGPNSQATASSLDEKTGVLVYTQVNKDAIGCWNSVRHADEYSADTNGIIAADNETLIFPNDLKVDKNGNLWVVSDRLPQYIYKQLDYKDVNFRVLTASVAEAIKGTVCDNA
nr:PREDICTED: protein yellow [Bemisia tabaci]